MKLNSRQLITGNAGLLNSIADLMPDGFLVLNSSNQIIEANENAARLFGWPTSHDLLGKSFSITYSDDGEMDNFLAVLSEYKYISNYENTFIKAGGETFVASYSARSFYHDQLNEELKLVIVQSTTGQLKTAAEFSRVAEYAKKTAGEFDRFTYIVSHDLKAPLRAIRNLSEWIQEDLGTSLTQDTECNFRLLRSRVYRLEAMISGLSEYFKVSQHKAETESVDVATLIEEVLNQFSTSSLKAVVDQEMPVLKTWRAALKTVFINLIDNAIKFNNKVEGRLNIHSNDLGSHWQFSVEDDGPGIGPEHREKVFELFQTLEPKDKTENVGIGLTLVKKIMEECGGSIQIGESVLGGCQVTFTWPKEVEILKINYE